MSSKCHKGLSKRFGRYVERTGEAIPERADAETTDGPSGRDLR
jgi:hypothetical protein